MFPLAPKVELLDASLYTNRKSSEEPSQLRVDASSCDIYEESRCFHLKSLQSLLSE